jgi:hypothetical protein
VRTLLKLIESLWYMFTATTEKFETQTHRELKEIEKQMIFWHAEESRVLAELKEACRRGDTKNYRIYWEQHQVVCHRCRKEVTEKLEALK